MKYVKQNLVSEQVLKYVLLFIPSALYNGCSGGNIIILSGELNHYDINNKNVLELCTISKQIQSWNHPRLLLSKPIFLLRVRR